jgi:hypothetical protein
VYGTTHEQLQATARKGAAQWLHVARGRSASGRPRLAGRTLADPGGVGQHEQARTAFGEAARIIQGLAEGIKDEMLRTRFLTGPQIQPVLQHARGEASQAPTDHEEQSGR